jgi:hypothetical protein
MRTPNQQQVKLVNFHRRFCRPIEDQDLWTKPLKGSVHRWFRPANIHDLYIYRDVPDFLRIGSRLLERGSVAPALEPLDPPAMVLSFKRTTPLKWAPL